MTAVTILASETLKITDDDDVVLVRRRVRELARDRGFDSFGIAAITTAASELARNAWVHGKGGDVTLQSVSNDVRNGLRLVFVDRGPGILNLEQALTGGYSTANSLGLGLSGSRRLVDDFVIETVPEQGTKVIVTKWARI